MINQAIFPRGILPCTLPHFDIISDWIMTISTYSLPQRTDFPQANSAIPRASNQILGKKSQAHMAGIEPVSFPLCWRELAHHTTGARFFLFVLSNLETPLLPRTNQSIYLSTVRLAFWSRGLGHTACESWFQTASGALYGQRWRKRARSVGVPGCWVCSAICLLGYT